MEKKYTSEMNYNNPSFAAGSVFTEAQWIAKGGREDSLQAHVAKGYIVEWEGQAPPAISVSPSPLAEEPEAPETTTEDSAETEVIDVDPSEDSSEEESEEEVVEEEIEQAKPEGIWNFKADDLKELPIEALNTMYKSHAEKNGIANVRAYKDKDALIKKMCSEAAKED